jgi:ABC-type glycerol-3-phosphate transport system substrate-binding protein
MVNRFLLILPLAFLTASVMAGAKTVTIQFVCNDPPEIRKGTYERAVKEFESSHPNIKVKYSLVNSGDFIEYLLTRAAAGTMPDVFYNRGQFTDSFASRNLIRNLDGLIKRDKIDLTDLWKAQIPELQYNGSYYCMPENYSTTCIVYNADMAREAGIVIPNSPWSWDDLWLAAAKLTKKDGMKTVRYGFHSLSAGWLQLGFFYGQSGKIYGPNNRSMAMGDTANVKFLDRMGEMIDKGIMAPWWADFANKKVAMGLDGSWNVDIWRQQLKNARFNIAYAPNGDFTHTPSVTNTGAGYAIATQSKNLEAAWEWVKFLTSPECQQYIVVDKLLTVPARKSTAKRFAEKVKNSGDPKDAQIWLDSAERGWSLPSTPYHDELVKNLSNELGLFSQKKKSASAALQAIDKAMNDYIKRKLKK